MHNGPLWVKRRNARCEHIESALLLKADSSRTSLEVRFVPNPDIDLSLDRLVGRGQQRGRYAEAEDIGRFQVD
jgi:hypothetical protein